ncbi:MAG: Crp/Fnr family transcriptional regulator, partial [Wenzhouxiangellaceae bacterium]|nr:Crp/Fnr family transcriptional regulator [Wenzhouxiangellaceae bacterium]
QHHEQDHRHDRHRVINSVAGRCGNKIVDALPLRQRGRLLEQCETVQMQFGELLTEKAMRVRHVYFPLTGFASLVISLNERPPLELNMIGSEGMLGAEWVLGARTTPYTSLVQGSGTALRLSVTEFDRQLGSDAALRCICNRYFYVLVEQLTQSIACNCFHGVPQRLARWLLMTHDRADGKTLELTHAVLATMLGVRRSAVTIAAGNLQHQQLISYSRGLIRVLSRGGLEEASCECYAASIKSYESGLGAD